MRLTEGIKQIIIKNAVNGLKDEKQKMKEIESELGIEILKSIPNYDKALELVGEWIQYTDRLYLNVDDYRITIRLINKQPFYERLIDIASFDKFYTRIKEFQEKQSALQNKEYEIIFEIKNILKRVTTIKQLIDIWPKAKDLLPLGFGDQIKNNSKLVDTDKLDNLLSKK